MPLLMDLKCPVEYGQTEILRDSAGHAQADLTFLNLSECAVTGLRAMVTLEDERGQAVDIRPLYYRDISAPGRSHFTLSLPADAWPRFENARVLIHEVWLAQGTAYRLDEDALLDCTVREEPPGERRNALIGVAGADALCYAQAGMETWVCLCGRYNENARRTCRRCGRSRREAFELTPELAMERYAEQQHRESDRLETARMEAQRQAAQLRRRRRAGYLRRIKREGRRTWCLRIALAALLVLALWLWRYYGSAG